MHSVEVQTEQFFGQVKHILELLSKYPSTQEVQVFADVQVLHSVKQLVHIDPDKN